jgi:predicted NUDIX family NTP pyrophosphohydrolase
VAAKHSAGILLYRLAGDGPEFLLAHPGGPFWVKKDAGAWTIPKGEVEPGEDTVTCALRELREELGAAPEIELETLVELGSVKQRSGKLVDAWAAEAEFDPETLESNTFELEWPPRSGNLRSFPEVDRAAWLGPEEAREKILAAQQPFLDRLLDHLGRS